MSKPTHLVSAAFKSIPQTMSIDVSGVHVFPQRVQKVTWSSVLSASFSPSMCGAPAAPPITALSSLQCLYS